VGAVTGRSGRNLKKVPEVPFPFDRLDGRPLIYVYFGGASGARRKVLQQIAASCASLECQVVIALGEKSPVTDFLGMPIVVEFAPQRRLLSVASLVISHEGFSTTMEALAFRIPMVVIPFNGDQPGVRARVRYSRSSNMPATAERRQLISVAHPHPAHRRGVVDSERSKSNPAVAKE
jgi:zeaxanthin glucosyltransferase